MNEVKIVLDAVNKTQAAMWIPEEEKWQIRLRSSLTR
jgi:hypothetical protein